MFSNPTSATEASNLPTIAWSALTQNQLLGSGGFANVYQGIWQGTEVAIKQLRVTTLPSDIEQDFIRETNVHAQCNFPRIVRLFGVTREPGHFAMVLEYLPKGSLYDALHNRSLDLPWPTRWEIAIDIASGLGYLHGKNILHSDLKSLNVLLDNSLRAKISDFGLSTVKTHTATTATVATTQGTGGSIRWRAPETFTRKYQASPAADIYSFGMILWEIATRTLPYVNETSDQVVMSFIKDGDLEDIPKDCPPAYAAAIMQCWQAPASRPSASALHTELDASRPVVPADTTAKPKSWHFSSTHRSSATMHQGFEVFPAGPEDMCKVLENYQHAPIPGYDIKSVNVIHNPSLDSMFAGRLITLQQRHGNPAFTSGWHTKGTPGERQQRQNIEAWHQQRAKPYTDTDAPNVRLLPLWHGTDSTILDSICRAGFANLGVTDSGFYGKGLYGSNEAEYAYRVYATQNYSRTGALLMVWMASHSALPVILSDTAKLAGKGNYQNYDAHLIPVTPRNPNNPHEVNYDPCRPEQHPTNTEMVVFETASCLPRYHVVLQPSLPKEPPMDAPPPATPTCVPTTPIALVAAAIPATMVQSIAPSPPELMTTTVTLSTSESGEANYDQGITYYCINARFREAHRCFIQASETQYPAAYLALYSLYSQSGYIGAKNPQEANKYKNLTATAIRWFVAQADTGKASAQINLATCYAEGIGVNKDPQQEFAWLQKAAKQGHVVAQQALGSCYENGTGVAKDPHQAIAWYQKAAKQGYARAQVDLGLCYKKGIGVSKDMNQAIAWIQKAANQGSALAQSFMGACYYQGTQDFSKSIPWFQKAADQEFDQAQYNLGYSYEHSLYSDYRQAAICYRKAADQGYASAQWRLGCCYYNGTGVTKDVREAIAWYQKAADQGEEDAQYNLAERYEYGMDGVKKDLRQAFALYKKSAEQGETNHRSCYTHRQIKLGDCYQNGIGVNKDLHQAAVWYKKAADKGDTKARAKLAKLQPTCKIM